MTPIPALVEALTARVAATRPALTEAEKDPVAKTWKSILLSVSGWHNGDHFVGQHRVSMEDLKPGASAHTRLAWERHHHALTRAAQDVVGAVEALTAHLAQTPGHRATQRWPRVWLQINTLVAHADLSAHADVGETGDRGEHHYLEWPPGHTPSFAQTCALAAHTAGVGTGPVWEFRATPDHWRALTVQAQTPQAGLAWLAASQHPSLLAAPYGDKPGLFCADPLVDGRQLAAEVGARVGFVLKGGSA